MARNGILTLQLIISSFFIIGGLIIHQQVKYMTSKDLGFNGSQVININFRDYSNFKPYLKYQRLKTEISKIDGVEEVSFGEALPASGSRSSSNIDYLDKTLEGQHGAMDYNYLQMMGVKLKTGRWLDPKLSSDTINTVIINEALVKEFGWNDQEALTKKIKPGFDNKPYQIVGIVKDFNLAGLNQKVNPVVFFIIWKLNGSAIKFITCR
ncbi:ABC transporter permease [Kaistella anthropi]|nr:ABC transporter permease [Kaistella anthropi]